MRAPRLVPAACIALAVVAVACGSSPDDTRGTSTPATVPAPVPPPPAQAAGNAAGPVTTTTVPGSGLTLGGIDLGRSVNPDNTMHDATRVFVPGDTVYASVTVEGTAPSAAVVARWTSGAGELLYATGQTVVPAGKAVAAFSFTRREGIPVGSYHVDILLNGVRVGSADFDVGK